MNPMSDESRNNEPTQPFKRGREETQPVNPGDGPTQPIPPYRNDRSPATPVPPSWFKTGADDEKAQAGSGKPERKKRGGLILVGILIILVGAAFGSLLGYQSGMQSRLSLQKNEVATHAAAQFQLGLDDLNAK